MAETRDSFIVDFRANTRGLARGAQRAIASIRRVGAAAGRVGAISFGGAVVALGALTAAARASAGRLDALNKAGQGLNATVAQMQALSEVAELSGTNLDTVSRAAGNLQKALAKAIASGDKGGLFERLGLDPEKLKRRGSLRAFLDVADRLRRDPKTRRRRSVTDIIGSGGELFGTRAIRDLIPLIQGGASSQFGETFRGRFKQGLLATDSEGSRAEAIGDEFTRITTSLQLWIDKLFASEGGGFLEILKSFRMGLDELLTTTLSVTSVTQAFGEALDQAAAIVRAAMIEIGGARAGAGAIGNAFTNVKSALSSFGGRLGRGLFDAQTAAGVNPERVREGVQRVESLWERAVLLLETISEEVGGARVQ